MVDDDEAFPITCPSCGNHFQESVGRMRAQTRVRCPECAINLCYYPEDLARALEEMDSVRTRFIRNVRPEQ